MFKALTLFVTMRFTGSSCERAFSQFKFSQDYIVESNSTTSSRMFMIDISGARNVYKFRF